MSANDKHDFNNFLQVPPLVSARLTFGDYLVKLSQDPRIGLPSQGRLALAIRDCGVIEPAAHDAHAASDRRKKDRAAYLWRLKMRKVTPYKLFDSVRGAHLVIHQLVQFLEGAGENGSQLRKALFLIGEPGGGKTLIVNILKTLLETMWVYVVDECPIYENPINLLRLLSPKQQGGLAKALGLGNEEAGQASLKALIEMAGQPCVHCRKRLYFASGKEAESVDLADISVKLMRPDPGSFGISTWSLEAGDSLLEAIARGSRGLIDLSEACAVSTNEPGKCSVLEPLIRVTEERTQPDLNHKGSFLPVDCFIIGQTNPGGWQNFLKNQTDPRKFQERILLLQMTYPTAIIEEELIYADHVNTLTARPHVGPLALKLLATFAVMSRLKEVDGMTTLDKARLLNGDLFSVRRKGSFDRFWTDEELDRLMADTTGSDGKRDGTAGLSVRTMKNLLSEAISLVNAETREPEHRNEGACLAEITALDLLRRLSDRMEEASAWRKFLKRPATIEDEPAELERYYRILLRRQLLEVFAPDFAERKQTIFALYCLHAQAFANGESSIKHANKKDIIPVDTSFLDGIDGGRSLKPEISEVRQYRGSIAFQLADKQFRKGTELSRAGHLFAPDDFSALLPELNQAIEEFIFRDISKAVENILNQNPQLLADEDRHHYEQSMQRFENLGYCQTCLKRAIAYARELTLWAKPQE